MLKVTQQDPGGSSSLLSTSHGAPKQGLQGTTEGAYSNFRKIQIPDLPPIPPQSRPWGLCALTSSGNQRLTRWARPGGRVWTRRRSDHGREEGKGDPEGAFRADLAYF